MRTFPVSPEYCLILKALNETSSLREAAALLETDPAHLTRKLQKLSQEHELVQKIGNKWAVTEEGARLARWVNESITRQEEILEEKATINISSFAWLAEEMLIPHYPRLQAVTENKHSFRFCITTASLEDDLISGRSDFAITCHPPNDPVIAHKVFNPDPWYIVVPASWAKSIRKLESNDIQKFLNTRPFVRLTTLNPEKMLGFVPEMISDLMVDGVVAARAAVKNDIGWSCLPGFALTSLLEKNEIVRVPLESSTSGQLSIWWPRSRTDSKILIRKLSAWLTEISQ